MKKCLFTGHEADPIRNQGLEFGHCRHCRRDLLRANGRWRSVPRGFRIVWPRTPQAAERNAAQFELDLVSPGRAVVPWDSRRALVAVARNRAAELSRLFAVWLVTRRGSAIGRAPMALLRLRARIHVILRPVAKGEVCIRLPYRPIALQD